jgi:hypothetical protein
MNIDPRGINSMAEWVDFMILPLQKIMPTIGPLLHEKEWKRWARGVTENSTIAKFGPPDPFNYGDWREWAYHFNQAVKLV